MAEDLEQFRENFIANYVDKSLDRLLDLRNAIKRAMTPKEIDQLIQVEQSTVLAIMGLTLIEEEEVHNEKNEEDDPGSTTIPAPVA